MKSGGVPLLDSHQNAGITNALGRVKTVWFDRGALMATLTFNQTPSGSMAMGMVERSEILALSCGYRVETWQITDSDGDPVDENRASFDDDLTIYRSQMGASGSIARDGIGRLADNPEDLCAHADRNLLFLAQWNPDAGHRTNSDFLTGQNDTFRSCRLVEKRTRFLNVGLGKLFPGDEEASASIHFIGGRLPVVLEKEDHLGWTRTIQVRLPFDDGRNISPQLAVGAVSCDVGLVSGQGSIDAQNNNANDGSRQCYFLECVMLFVLRIGIAVLGGCAFFQFGAHTLRAVFGGAVLIALGAPQLLA